MTTIAAYNVSLSLDANRYIDSSKLSRKETASLQRIINSTRSPAERYERAIEQLDKAVKSGAISHKTYNNLLQKQKEKLKQADMAVGKYTVAMTKSAGAVKMFAGSLAAIGMVQFIKSSVSLAINAEKTAASFEILTGSAEEANRLLTDIRQIASASPITLQGMQSATKRLLSFNVASEKIIPTLQRLSAISMGNEQQFETLVDVFGKVRNATIMQGEEFNRLVDAGFNPLAIIGEKTGESFLELKKRMEKGLVTFEEVEQAFITATSEGGKFFGMNEQIAETLGGRLAIAMSKIQEEMKGIGEAIAPLIMQIVELDSAGRSGLTFMRDTLILISDGLATVIALAKDAAMIFSRDWTNPQTEAFENFNKLLDDRTERINKFESEARQAENAAKGLGAESAAAGDKAAGAFGKAAEAAGKLGHNAKTAFAMADNVAEQLNKAALAVVEFDISDEQKRSNELQRMGASQEEIKTIMAYEAKLKKMQEAKKLEEDRLAAFKKAEEQSKNLAATALENAQAYFAKQREIDAQRKKDIVGMMSNASMEVGGGADVAFLAKQQNKLMAGNKAGQQPTEKQLLSETKRQYQLLLQQKMKDEQRNKLLEKMIATISEAKIEPIR